MCGSPAATAPSAEMNAFEITTFLITPSNLDYYGSFLFYLHLYWDTLKSRNITVRNTLKFKASCGPHTAFRGTPQGSCVTRWVRYPLYFWAYSRNSCLFAYGDHSKHVGCHNALVFMQSRSTEKVQYRYLDLSESQLFTSEEAFPTLASMTKVVDFKKVKRR